MLIQKGWKNFQSSFKYVIYDGPTIINSEFFLQKKKKLLYNYSNAPINFLLIFLPQSISIKHPPLFPLQATDRLLVSLGRKM